MEKTNIFKCKPPEVQFTIRNRVPYNKQFTNLACLSRTVEYWPSIVFVRTERSEVRTVTTSVQYSPVRPSRSVSKRSIFYLYFKNALSFVTDIGDPKLQLQWDPKILQFVESLEYHGHKKKAMNYLRGTGFEGSGKGVAEEFDWASWNCPILGKTTTKKNCTGYTNDNGIYKSLFTSFLELAGRKNTPVTPLPLIDNDTVQVLPLTIQKDGMGLSQPCRSILDR